MNAAAGFLFSSSTVVSSLYCLLLYLLSSQDLISQNPAINLTFPPFLDDKDTNSSSTQATDQMIRVSE